MEILTPQDSKPKVLFHTTHLEEGGAEKITRAIVLGLAKKGVAVKLAVLEGSGPSRQDWPSDLVPLIDLQMTNPVKSIFALAKLFNLERPDLVVTALHQPSSAAILAKRISKWKPKLLVTIHSNVEQESKDPASRNRRMMPHVVKRLYPHADGVIAISAGTASAAIRLLGLSQSKVHTIPNPVITSDFFSLLNQEPCQDYSTAIEEPLLVGLGRLTASKDFATALRALAIVKQSMDFRYILVGDGEERPKLEQLAVELGLTDQVVFAGFQKNPYPFLKKARLLLMTSRLEGLPTVLIESLAAGTPVIFTDCPSGPAEILQPPRYGVCPPMGDVEAIAKAVLEELAKPKVSPPQESWEPYTEDASIAGYRAYFSEILGREV